MCADLPGASEVGHYAKKTRERLASFCRSFGVHLGIATCIVCWPSISPAAEVDDCLLSNLKGVSSDLAARMVREACERKVEGWRRAELEERYGKPIYKAISVVSTEWVEGESKIKSGLRAVVQNDQPVTALLIRLRVWDDISHGLSGSVCVTDPVEASLRKDPMRPTIGEVHSYLFKLNLKPGARATLITPIDRLLSDPKMTCSSAEVVRGRDTRSTDLTRGTYPVISSEEAEAMGNALHDLFSPTSIWHPPSRK